MRNKVLLLLICCLSLMLTGCGSKGQIEQDIAKSDTGIVRQELKLWNCDYSLFDKAKKVTVYRLNPVSEPTASDMAIAKFKVIDKGTLLNKKQINVLSFLILSPLCYTQKKGTYKKLFSPYFAYEYKVGEKSLYLLVDISSDEWAIASKDEVIQQRFNLCRRELIQIGIDIFPDDHYIQSIIQNIDENEK